MSVDAMISVIIPVYNVENTLMRCVDSILNQSYKDFELILIDDGSNDNSSRICDKYEKEDSRVRVIHKETNEGVSSARNMGLDVAEGTYITFVDSDDYVETEYLQELIEAFQNGKVDVVYMEYNRITASDEKNTYSLPTLKNVFIDDLVKLSETDMFGYTWIKAIRKEFIGDIRFNETLDLYEDEVFTCELFAKKGSIAKVNKPIYNYVQSAGSLVYRTRKEYYKNCEAIYHAWKNLLPTDQEEYKRVLQNKANHMARVCKYYGLEKKVNPFSFFRGLVKCDFIRMEDLNDSFINDLKQGKWITVWWEILRYRLINFMKKN